MIIIIITCLNFKSIIPFDWLCNSQVDFSLLIDIVTFKSNNPIDRMCKIQIDPIIGILLIRNGFLIKSPYKYSEYEFDNEHSNLVNSK